MSALKIDPETGEILPQNIMAKTETAPAIIIHISDVEKYHAEPEKLADMISAQAGFMVFDVSNDKGRKACASHSMSIIKCITPANNASIALAAEAKKVINKDIYFRKTFESCLREVAAYHRKPLTEYETEQKRIKDEQDERERLRLEEANYLIDWDDALNLDELFVLRKAKAEADRIESKRLKAIEDKRLFHEAVIKQAETLRLQIESEAKSKAEAEQAAKLEAERAKVRAEELAKINEEMRLRQVEFDKKQQLDREWDAEQSRIKAGDYASKSGPEQTPYMPPKVEILVDMALPGSERTVELEMVTIPKAEFEEMKKRVDWLEFLEVHGVDAWSGYSETEANFLLKDCPF